MSDKETGSPPNQGRWWEGYLVRYLVGALIGAIALSVIAIEIRHKGIHSQERYLAFLNGYFFDKDKGLLAGTAMFIAGSLYCYLASAPITVIHAARMLNVSLVRRPASLIWIFTAIFSIAGFFTTIYYRDEELYFVIDVTLFLLSIPALWIVIAQWGTWLALTIDKINSQEGASSLAEKVILWTLNRCVKSANAGTVTDAEFIQYNRKLSKARAPDFPAREIRETYSHLREHANAIFIVAIEISLTALLIFLHRRISNEPHYWLIILLGLMIWLIPNLLPWGQANRLERDLANNPDKYKELEAKA